MFLISLQCPVNNTGISLFIIVCTSYDTTIYCNAFVVHFYKGQQKSESIQHTYIDRNICNGKNIFHIIQYNGIMQYTQIY